MHTLFNLEVSDRLAPVSRFVNVGRHDNNLLANRLCAWSFVSPRVLRHGYDVACVRWTTPKVLIRSLPVLSPSPVRFCDLCRGLPARSIDSPVSHRLSRRGHLYSPSRSRPRLDSRAGGMASELARQAEAAAAVTSTIDKPSLKG
jgi:hypothetical protein